jgi:hypothetical protein
MINKAISNLRPASSFSLLGDGYETLIWQDSNTEPPTESEVQAEVARLQAEYDAQQYQRDRVKEYPSIQEQLDMQYWDAVNGTTVWQDTINAIKAKYPKVG